MVLAVFRVAMMIMLIGLPLGGILHSIKVIITGTATLESKVFIFTVKEDIYHGNVARRFGAIAAVSYTLMLFGLALTTSGIFGNARYLTLVFCGMGIGLLLFGFFLLERADRQLTTDD